jgi:hypothetical protein
VPENTVTRSFRINETAFLALEEEAKKRNISINTLVNQLFLSFANFDRYFQRFGMVKISKVSYRKTLKVAPDQEIAELAREVARNSGKVIILARHGTMSLSGVLDWLKNLGCSSSSVQVLRGVRKGPLYYLSDPVYSFPLE